MPDSSTSDTRFSRWRFTRSGRRPACLLPSACLFPRGLWVGMSLLLLALFPGCDDQTLVYQKSIGILNQKAQQYMAAGDSTKAICRLEAALDLVPTQKETLNNIAIAYHSAERFQDAVETYKKLMQADPANQADYAKSMGISYEAWGDKVLQEATDPKKAAQKATAKSDALAHYQSAIESYRQADSSQKAGDGSRLEKQIKALEARMAELKQAKP